MIQIATISFDRCDDEVDWDRTDIHGLQESVMVALDGHFVGYGEAAEAQREYGRVKDSIDAGGATLFGAMEAMRAGLAAHPKAREWASFELTAAEGISPFCFTIRFTDA